MTLLNPIYELIARIIMVIHSGLAPIFGKGSGWSWGLSIVFLTMLMRLLLFPLFVKQIKTQRAMQLLQPKLKELQVKYKGDRETLNVEMMKLYKTHGANPLAGCLPLLLQMPVFFALFHVLSRIRPDSSGHYRGVSGLSTSLVESAAHAKIVGAPIAASFKSSNSLLHSLSASPGTVKVVAAVMVVLMGASTFWTQYQLMSRTAASGGTTINSQQKVLLYVLPFSFLFAGFNFPIGVLLYWLTTNLWSMAQQHFVIAKMGAYGPVSGNGASPAIVAAPKKRRWSGLAALRGGQSVEPGTAVSPESASTPPAPGSSTGPKSAGSTRVPKNPTGSGSARGGNGAARRPPNSTNRRKGSRRGGRH
ncbi:MAG: membrane protein insertase YidC [Frankiaceae bacterium]